jgi:hypothetical protein
MALNGAGREPLYEWRTIRPEQPMRDSSALMGIDEPSVVEAVRPC